MERKIINDSFSVSGQIGIEDVPQLKAQGIKTIICNRPDNEDAGQVEADKIKAAAEKNGVEFHFMPVISGQVAQEQGEEFARIVEAAAKPIHAYCRSGTRCTILWAISQLLAGKDKNSIVESAASAGYDLSKTLQ